MKIDFPKLAAAILVSLSAGAIGSVFTFSAISSWYSFLSKPSFAPPNWVFGPVWTALYVLMGIAAYLVWVKGWEKKEVQVALKVFMVQLGLNALWSILFFGTQNLGAAFFELIALWIAIAWTIKKFYAISKNAAYLLVPYILWVSFAGALNYFIWILN